MEERTEPVSPEEFNLHMALNEVALKERNLEQYRNETLKAAMCHIYHKAKKLENHDAIDENFWGDIEEIVKLAERGML